MQESEINIKVSNETLQKLEGYAKKANVDVVTYISNSVRVMNALQEEKLRNNSRVYVGDSHKVYKEIVVP
jgi:ABC-type uncharacterized transport system substrate-binding protein